MQTIQIFSFHLIVSLSIKAKKFIYLDKMEDLDFY